MCTHLHSSMEAWAGSSGAMGGGPCALERWVQVNVIEGRGYEDPCTAQEWEPLSLLPYLCVILGDLPSWTLVTLLLASHPWDPQGEVHGRMVGGVQGQVGGTSKPGS